MKIFLASLIVFAIAMICMAIGVIVKKRRLRGTCGGLAHLQEEQGHIKCDTCSKQSVDATHTDECQPVAQEDES